MWTFCCAVAICTLVTFAQTVLVKVNENFIKDDKDCGEPLFLSPLIKAGKLEEARSKARVDGLPNAPQIESYSGYLTVNEEFNSNIFFWFFPSKVNDTYLMNKLMIYFNLIQNQNAPISLWLQGGPGASSLFGLFCEHGPYQNLDITRLTLRNYSWIESMSLIYFDNPVGTGFSFTSKDQGFATTEDDVARDLYSALQQFFTLFSKYRSNDFYLTGESYAGKYVPAIGELLHTKRNDSNVRLKGVAIGNGCTDPVSMADYSTYLYQISLLDKRQVEVAKKYEEILLNNIKNKQYVECALKLDEYLYLPKSFFSNVTGMTFYYNMLISEEPQDQRFYKTYVNLPTTRKALHVGNKPFNDDSEQVKEHLLADICQSSKSQLITLMENYKVLLYSGQLDISVPTSLTTDMIKTLNWKDAKSYFQSKKLIWKVDDQVAGYLKKYNQFYFLVVRNAGHILPYDQPKIGLEMISQFINDQL